MKKSIKYLLSVTAILILAACMKQSEDEIIGCDPVISAAGFQLVDKTSGLDLFLESTPTYKPADLRIYPVNYKNETDTLALRPIVSGTRQVFVFELKPAKVKDTVLLKIADTRMDTLVFTVKMPSNPCLRSTVDQAWFNGNQIIRDTDLLILKK